MMLDTAAAFDALVRRNAADEDQVNRILGNTFYRNISGSLSGTQEYMAAETLHQLHDDDRFDLVVVDTPPSRNALDFLEASGVLAPVPRPPPVPAADAPGPPRDACRQRRDAAVAAGHRQGRRLGGPRRCRGVLPGLRRDGARIPPASRRRHRAAALGRHPLRRRRLAAPRHRGRGGVVRRSAHRPGDRAGRRRRQSCPSVVRARHRRRCRSPLRPPPTTPDVAALWRNVGELRALAESAADELAPFAELLGSEPFASVPLLPGDVHDLATLTEIRRYLFPVQ